VAETVLSNDINNTQYNINNTQYKQYAEHISLYTMSYSTECCDTNKRDPKPSLRNCCYDRISKMSREGRGRQRETLQAIDLLMPKPFARRNMKEKVA
jgi:hypothetical protein